MLVSQSAHTFTRMWQRPPCKTTPARQERYPFTITHTPMELPLGAIWGSEPGEGHLDMPTAVDLRISGRGLAGATEC